jgi:hypothetical protein
VRHYRKTRPRGLAPWTPQRRTLPLLADVERVFDDYREWLPITVRDVFYRLVGAYGYAKDEGGLYGRVQELLVRARRSGRIPFEWIRDDGAFESSPPFEFHGEPGFWATVRRMAENFREARLDGQAIVPEVWVEAAGMLPLVERVAHPFGVSAFPSGGFDSLTAKYETAQRIAGRERPTLVLHVGDFDSHGLAIFDSLTEDVAAFIRDLGGEVEFRRAIVTEEQIENYGLSESPPELSRRTEQPKQTVGGWVGGTYQAEALHPADRVAEIKRAIRDLLDLGKLEAVKRREPDTQAAILAKLDRLGA